MDYGLGEKGIGVAEWKGDRMIKPRIWFYKPQRYWHGWSTLSPILRGHDDECRWTLVLGWTITGRIIIPLWDCGDAECHEFMLSLEALEAQPNRRI